MSNNEITQFTDKQEKFLNLLKSYPVKNPETIVSYVSSQGEDVLEDPQRLMEALADCEISPVRRKQVWKHWLNEQRIEIPEGLEKRAGLPKEQLIQLAKAEDEEKRRRDEKYSVETETGDIRVATKDEPNPLSWAEAEKLSAKIKRGIEERKRAETKTEKGEKEPPFIQDAEGNWMLNPKARITGMELLAFEAVRKSQERGQPLDPFEVMKERAKDIEMIRTVFGGGKEGGKFLDSVEDLVQLKTLLGADEELKTLLAGIYKRLGEGEGGKGASEEVKALTERIDKLTEELHQKELERRDEQIRGLTTEIANLRTDFAKAVSEARAKDEYGIMSEGLGVIDRRLGAIEGIVRARLGRQPALLPEGEKGELTKAISAEAIAEEELDKLAEQAFYQP